MTTAYEKSIIVPEPNTVIDKFSGRIRYATEMLAIALIECVKLNIKKVLITCDKNNVASAKTIINNDGKLENEIAEGNGITQRYWITLD